MLCRVLFSYLPNEENSTRHNMDIAHSYAIKTTPAAGSTVYTFTGNGNWDVAANWLNNQIPPAVLPAGNSIIINPLPGGKCLLNTTQIISRGATITVMPGKTMQVPGSLIEH